jgi:RHS repeat-associated protein
MKRIIYTFLMGLICAFTAIGQPNDLTLNTAESGTQLHQATSNITLAPGYSYTPSSGTMLSEIIWQTISGDVSYSPAIDPGTYAINTSLAVGKTPGNLSVGGSAGYNIPIEVPAGTNGMQPSVNLNYSSDFSNGILGTGWSLGGLSIISRVNKTIYNDGKADAIRGDLTDKYALDGKRLVTLSGYTYGADNSLYGTELEEFSKIVSMGSSGTNQGPEYFIVYTKSGLIYEYGNTPDSKLKNGTSILKWKVNKITDRYNNYITFSYLSTDDELPIEMIEYTGNSSASQSPFAQILFNYMYRDDITRYVYGGKEFTRNILLDNIEIKTNGLLFKKYGFDYTGDGYTYAQLQKVTEYSSQNLPLNPTVFAWTTQTEQFGQANYSGTLDELVYIGDYNGDGRDDVVTTPNLATYTSADKWKLYLADASGTMVYISQGDLNTAFKTFKVNDFNGDGMTDLMMQENAGTYYFYQSTGTSFTRNTSSYVCPDIAYMDVVDYNGDGKLEFFNYVTSGAWYLYTYSGTLITSGSIPSFGKLLGSDKPQNRILDFNGDGSSDLLVLSPSSYKIYEFKGTNNTLIQTYTGSNIVSSDFLLFGDFNGDGGTDIIRSEPVPYPWYRLSLTSGGLQESFLDCFDFSTDFINNNRFYTRDMNADGKMDLVMVGKGFSAANPSNRINVALSAGTEFALTEYISSISLTGEDRAFNFGDYDGDGRDQLFYKYFGTSQLYSFASGTPSHLINTIIDGLGAKTTLTYLPMSNSSVYTRGTGATYQVSDFSSGVQLVSQATGDNGIGGTTSMSYQYAGAKIHREGKGFLCFSKVIATNSATGIFTESNYTYDGAYYYPQLQTVYTKRGSTTLSTTSNTWSTPMVLDATTKRIFPYISTSTQTDNLTGLSVATTVAYNSYGNPTSVSKNYGGTHVQTTTYAYNNELVSSWLIGRPTTITETSVRDSQTKTFTTTRTYFTTNNSPDIDQYNSGDGSYWQLNRDYDAFGNLWKEYKATTGLTEQTTVYTYWTNNVNVETVTGPDGNTTTYDYYPVTGRLHTVSDLFNNITTYNYDSNDQLSGTVPTEGVTTTINRSLSVTGGPAYACYYVQQTGNDGSDTKAWYDKLGRELRTETKKMGGQYVKVDKEYNNKGQLYRVSEPTTGTPSFWNILGYDDYGRTNSQDPHYGATTTIGYSNATVTRSVNGRNYTSVADAAGLITSRTDPGGSITYAYWPDGTLKSTLTPGSVSTAMTYDKNGNRLSLTDPSAGAVTNTWYGTGQPKTQQNGRGQTTTYTYQADGLLDYYTASPADEGQTNYTYNDKKQVSSITSPGGVSRNYTYDTKGRASSITESIDGVSNLVNIEYDTKGRLYRKYFNTSDYEQYDYDTNSGYLYRIQFNGATVWQLTTMDEYLRTRQATIGATSASWTYDGSKNMLSQIAATGVQQYDYSFDVNTGNLSSRTNYLKSKTETFGYDSDNLDRLASVTGPVNLSVGYTTNKNGNIQTKGDVGTYVYDVTQPYAVDQLTSGLNISATQQDITYYSFEKVKNITEGTKTADFVYNAEQQRIRMTLKTSGTATKTRWYFGGNCERELIGGVTTQYIWIGGDAYTAVAVAKKVGTGSWTVYNIFRDHLGTITHLKNGSNPADEYSFDAWGRRRDKDDWTMTLTSEPALFADRGFTAHEYLEDFNLYNMNGRLYDPVVGRFLNADPVNQDPTFSQNYNRYSYCLNNPLKYSDPSGNINQNPLPRQESNDRESGSGGSWMDMFGEPGYGGWGGIFGGVFSSGASSASGGNPTYAKNVLMRSKNGGEWSRSSGIYFYKSQDEAFMAGFMYINANNLWSNTSAGDAGNAYANYMASTRGDYYELTASLDGAVKPNPSQAAYLEAKFSFVGNTTYTGRCSQFVYDVYKNIGYLLGAFQRAADTGNYLTLKSTIYPVPGDIVQYLKADGALYDHVAIYAGDKSMFSSSSAAGMIILQPLQKFNKTVSPHFYHYVEE